MKHAFSVVLLALLLLGGSPALLSAAPAAGTALPNELVIKLSPGTVLDGGAVAGGAHAAALNTLLRQNNAGVARELGAGSQTYRVRLAGPATQQLAAAFAALPGVAYAEPNHVRTILRTTNDPLLEQQWSLRNINAFEGWDITTGTDVVIAMLDTGVSRSHPDLKDKLLPGYDFFNNDDNPTDDEGHGTHTAGTAAASANNKTGIAGVCWGCKILPVKVLGRRGQGDDATIAQGIRYAVDQGARIISMSLGGPEDTAVLRDAVQYARDRNVLLVAASGNDQQRGNAANYPAAYPGVLAVSATGAANTVTGFANTGDYVSIAAPGVGVWSTLWANGDTYGFANGTSSACPHVAGAAALVLSLRPDMSAEQVAQVLEASATDIGAAGRDQLSGYGLLNVRRALELASDPAVLSQSRIEGTVRGDRLDQVVVSLNTGQQTRPDGNGFFRFGNLPAGGYTVTVRFADGRTEQQQTYVSGTVLSVASLSFGGASGGSASTPTGAFSPVAPTNEAGVAFFPETQHTLRGTFRSYWERNGGLPIFGYPISEEFVEPGEDGRNYTVQYFERHKLELHPENAAPYNVLLTRLGDVTLQRTGRSWFAFPKGIQQDGCVFFEQTGHSVCGGFLQYWRSNGLELDGRRGKIYDESLALFGQPLSEPQIETLADGQQYTVQWFERARFEYHPETDSVLLGLLGNDLAAARR